VSPLPCPTQINFVDWILREQCDPKGGKSWLEDYATTRSFPELPHIKGQIASLDLPTKSTGQDPEQSHSRITCVVSGIQRVFFWISVVSSSNKRSCSVYLQSSKEGESCVFIYFLCVVGCEKLIGIP
jgi:hypothetical protein